MPSTPSFIRRLIGTAACLLLGTLPGYLYAAAINLSDNLAAPTAFTETVQGQTWVGAPFRTTTAATLSAVDLLLANPFAGTAELDLYTGSFQPNVFIGSLASPASYSPQLSLATFAGNGLALNAQTAYWVVLRSLSGRFDWAYTDSTAGSGVGFTPGWGVTDNAGASWFTEQSSPMQMRVAAAEIQAVPEPGSFALLTLGAGAFGLALLQRSRGKNFRPSRSRLATAGAALPLAFSHLSAADLAVFAPVSIVSPLPGESIRSAAVPVSVKLNPAVNAASLRAKLNGQDVTSSFVRSGHCRPDGCPYTATFYPGGGLRSGKNLLWVQADALAGRSGTWHMSFDWLPSGTVADIDSTNLPPAVGFSTVTPGGGSPWVSLYSNRGAGSATTYPKTASCTTRYQVLALNRTNLTFKSYNCYNDDAALTTALKAFTAEDLVVAGTTAGSFPQEKLDTTPIGGTNYGNTNYNGNSFPNGFMIVGVGGAPAGQAYENANTDESGNGSDKWARADGLLAVDESGHYNFHSSDFSEFKVRPLDSRYSSASITVGDATYTPPTGTNGFWLLILERRHLYSDPGCAQSPSTQNLFINCGTFYATGASSAADAAKATADLASKLKAAGQSDLIFLTAVGIPSASTSFPSSDLADATNNLGGSGYTLGRLHSATAPTYVLVSSNDSGFRQALTGSAVVSTNMGEGAGGTNNGQTGFVKGMLGRDRNGLYRPLAASQETKDTIDDIKNSADFSAYQLFWSQPAPWPAMDTPGRVAAYRYLSYTVVRGALQGASGSHVDDLRYYYPGDQNITVVTGSPDPSGVAAKIAYPATTSAQFCWAGPDGANYPAPVCFVKAEADAVAAQLQLERGYLKQSIDHFAGTGSGRGLRDALAGDSNSITANMFSAMATVQNSEVASAQATVSTNPSKWLKLAGTVTSIGSAANPAFGVVGGLLNASSAVAALGTPSYTASVIPSAFADYETTVADLTQHTADYTREIQASFDTSLDNVYSDWGKLSGVGLKVADSDSKSWYFADQTTLEKLADPASKGALASFYLQLLPTKYEIDYWPAQAVKTAGDIGTMNHPYMSIPFCDYFYRMKPLPSWSWMIYTTPGSFTKSDIFVIGGEIKHNNSPLVTEQFPSADLLSKLFNPQDAPGNVRLPRDLFFAPNGPLSRRAGANFNSSGGSCTQ